MGLDAVELVLRVEEFFSIEIADPEAAAVRTVGDFYTLICNKVGVLPLQNPMTAEVLPLVSHKTKTFLFLVHSTPLPAPADALPWSPQSVWDCLVSLIVDQLCLQSKDITFDANFVDDLGLD